MKITTLLFGFLALIYTLSGCSPMPGGDTSSHSYSVTHTGIATVTRVYLEEGRTFVDVLFSVENINHEEPEAYTRIDTTKIGGADNTSSVGVGDKFKLDAMHLFEQKGTSTPKLIETLWHKTGSVD